MSGTSGAIDETIYINNAVPEAAIANIDFFSLNVYTERSETIMSDR